MQARQASLIPARFYLSEGYSSSPTDKSASYKNGLPSANSFN